MLPRILIGLVVLIVAIWIVAYATGRATLHRAMAEPWPYGVGTLDQLAARAHAQPSPEAEQIAPLLRRLPHGNADAWMAEQVKAKDDAVTPPPPYVAAATGILAEIVPLAIAAGDRIRWGERPPRVSNGVFLLGVLALERARAGDGAAAWEAVHAMWILARSAPATAVPQLERIAVAVARKLPPPAPPWFAQVAAFDPRRDGVAALQADLFAKKPGRGAAGAVVQFVFAPIVDRWYAGVATRTRRLADALIPKRCRVDEGIIDALGARGVPPGQIVLRTARLDAEIEAAAKILALKNERALFGRWPPPSPQIAASRCADNVWKYNPMDEGAMSLRMSKEPAWDPSAPLMPRLDFRYE